MNDLQKEFLKMVFSKDECVDKNNELEDLKGQGVLVETATKYYSGRLSTIGEKFVILTDAQWVSDTGRLSEYVKNPEGDDRAEFEPCTDPRISIGAIVTILPLPRVVRKLK